MRTPMAAVLLGSVLACGDPVGSGAPQLEVEQGGAVNLKVGESATVMGLHLTVRAVPEDSRCPRSVLCVWMGDGTVRLALRQGAADEVIRELHTHPDFANSAEVGGVVVRLIDLTPYPDEPGVIPQDQYVARLTVLQR